MLIPLQEAGPIVFQILIAAVPVYFLYCTFAELTNSTIIEIEPTKFTVRYSPLPWRKQKSENLADIKQLALEKTFYRGILPGRNADRTCYQIVGINVGGNRKILFQSEPQRQPSGLSQLQMEFVLSQASAASGIPA